jgi:hypothetical protein
MNVYVYVSHCSIWIYSETLRFEGYAVPQLMIYYALIGAIVEFLA